jgi:hypothetical protein
MKKDTIQYSIILFWMIFWIYLYNNPIHRIWQPLVLIIIPIYLFGCLIVKLFKKKYKEKSTIIIIVYSIVILVLHTFVDYDTFRPSPIKKIIVDRIDAGQWRALVLRKDGQFEEFAEDWFHIKILGINFRESFGIGNYDEYDNTINIYYEKYITNLSFRPLEYETINEAIKSNIKYDEE